MDQMKEAFEKLGLPKTATREELDDRYTLLMRQSRSEQRRDPDKADEVEERFTEVTRAYNYILDEEKRNSLEEISRKKYGKFKGMAGTAEKTEHFFRYYRYHVLGGLVILGIIIYAIISIFNHRAEQERLAKLPPVDLSVMFLGSYMTPDGGQDYKPIEDAILAQFPEWKRVQVNITYVPPMDSGSPNDVALLQKAMLMLTTERPDLYIMDKTAFNWVGNQGIARSLEPELEGELKSLVTPDMLVKTKLEEETAEKVYAVDIMNSPLAEALPLAKTEMIAGIRGGSEKETNALAFIKTYLEAAKTNQ
ncbi:J domain-containing protein [Paenibacillus sp. N3/727]|uniref:J domain-containing protein n=1 Tax=Paenibacillus sp. N3/727 TaxID=2925845 RepID=UPI001F53A347|nr:J domain-containing protein [Paenibacillus sp. N3/727]UNK17372.1 J domain-containing protein [Paenibacillus sp. N3/727]